MSLLPLALLLLLAPACRTRSSGDSETEAIVAALRTRGVADVIVALQVPTRTGTAEAGEQRMVIARIREEVLSSLPADEFTLRVVFSSAPAFAGRVLSERGLRRLLSHPRVSRVSLDGGGRGGRAGG